MPVVDVARDAGPVDDDLRRHARRHAPQLEQVDLLAIELEDGVLRIGQADEGQVVRLEVIPERARASRRSGISSEYEHVLLYLPGAVIPHSLVITHKSLCQLRVRRWSPGKNMEMVECLVFPWRNHPGFDLWVITKNALH